MMLLRLATVAAFSMCTASSVATRQDTQQLVGSFYPAYPAAMDLRLGAEPRAWTCHAVVESDAHGDPMVILAGYGNAVGSGTVRVLRRQSGSSFAVAWSPPADWDFGGGPCAVSNLNRTDEVGSEWHLQFAASRASYDWIVRWDGAGLLNLGPTEGEPGGSVYSAWVNLSLEDALNLGSDQALTHIFPTRLYVRKGLAYVLDRRLDLAVEVLQRTPTPFVDFAGFELRQPFADGYRLRITNGRFGGTNRSSSASVLLNGTVVVDQGSFGPNVEAVDVSIPRGLVEPGLNDVTIEMNGAVGDRLFVMVEHVPPQ